MSSCPCVTTGIFWKNMSKIPYVFYSVKDWLLNYPSWIFDMLQHKNRALLYRNFHCKFRCTRKRILSAKFPQFQVSTKMLKIGFFGLWKLHVNKNPPGIFSSDRILRRMPNLTSKARFNTLSRLPSRAIWKCTKSRQNLTPAAPRSRHFTLCRNSRKRKIFGKF